MTKVTVYLSLREIMLKSRAWFFNQINLDLKKEFEAGDEIEIQIMRVGIWEHQAYGPVEVSKDTLNEVLENFNNRKRGIDLVVDENHEDNHRALGIFRTLRLEEEALYATVQLTKLGAEKLTNGEYFYFSPEIIFGPYQDEETGERVKNLLIGGAFTNRPFFKKMEPVMASERSSEQQDHNTYLFLFDSKMDKFKELLEAAKAKDNLSFSEKYSLIKMFEELTDAEKAEVQAEVDVVVNAEPEDPKPEEKKDEEPKGEDNKGSEENTEKFNEMQSEIVKLRTQVKLQEVEKKFNEKFACTKSNPTGLFNEAKQKQQFTSFYITLNDAQQKAFDELMAGIDVTLPGKFSETGADAGKDNGISTKEQKYMEAVNKVASEKNISFHEATKHVDWNSIE